MNQLQKICTMEAQKKKLHFILFPWLAQGHINPFVELSKALAINGHTVSFLSTSVNISRIRPSLELHDCPGRIDLLELALPPTEGLTPGAESTADIPPDMALSLINAMDGMEKPFQSLLKQLSPDYIIHDFVQHWAPSAAVELRIPTVYFAIFAPLTRAYMWHPSKLRNLNITAEELATPPTGFPSSEISLRLYEARDLVALNTRRDIKSRVGKCLDGCVAMAIKSCFKEEEKYINYLQEVIGVPVLSVGPLMPAVQPVTGSSNGSDLLDWLDRQKAASVVFVSFGSETFLSRKQALELALGLEASGFPFLWSLRAPKFLDSGLDDPRDLLPEGFEGRTRDRGRVARGWVPQVRILSHPSVGGFLSHGGWNSAMEALSFGLPLILLPIRFDHGLNARQIEMELKAGVEIERGDDGSFTRENTCTALEMLMAGEEGKSIRLKAAEARDILVASIGRQQSYIHDFIQRLEQLAVAGYGKKSM